MSQPYQSFYDTECTDCGEAIAEGEDMYMEDSDKVCVPCAKDRNIVCSCGNYKKEDYEECFTCHNS